MVTTKQNWFRRTLSLLLALVMLFSMNAVNAFAEGSEDEKLPEGYMRAVQLDAPAEDGVYYASINLMNANSTGQTSMGNAALRGSSNFTAKNPEDSEYRSIVVVKDGKATAIVEFMPMGYLGTYGFMMELEAVTPSVFTQYGSPAEAYTAYAPAAVLAEHRTEEGEVVYDAYNDPESGSKFDGTDSDKHSRPAGYGYEEERLVNIVDQPYSHVLALDVTPVTLWDETGAYPAEAADFTVEHAAYVHVFVPVMFAISKYSGDQYARMQVDWTSLEKIEEPDNVLNYRLWSALQIEQGNYTDESYANLQTAIAEVQETITNVWPSQHLEMNGSGFSASPKLSLNMLTAGEQTALTEKLNAAIDGLRAAVDKTELSALIEECRALKETDYTTNSYTSFSQTLRGAISVNNSDSASEEDVAQAISSLSAAKGALEEVDNATKWKNLYAKAEALEQCDYTADSWSEFQTAWESMKNTKDVSTLPTFFQTSYISRLEKALDALVEKPVLDDDPNALADGKYTLKAYMFKAASPTVYSMSNNAINHNVWLEVKEGEYYLTIQFMGMSIYNEFGYLKNLKYFDADYSFGAYGTINGTLIDAEVITTQKDAYGNDIINKHNSADDLYPELVRIKLVEKAAGEYVPLQVFVPVMEAIVDELGTQPVLMQLDWSYLRTDDGTVQPKPPVVQSPAFDAVDKATGLKVHADSGVFDEGTNFVVSQHTEGELYDLSAEYLVEVGEKFKLYDIYFTDITGKNVQPNGRVTYSFPIPEGYNAQNIKIYRINEEADNIGKKTLFTSVKIQDGYLVMDVLQRTDKAVHYAVVEAGSVLAEPSDFTELKAKIAEAEALINDGEKIYTEESYEAVASALEKAKALTEDAPQTEIDDALSELKAALEALEYGEADYSAVDAAIASIPADTSDYTPESVQTVTVAVNAVVRGKNITEQNAVDAMAKAIEDAVAALAYKAADYTVVDGAIARIPADLSLYTNDSVQRLNDAREAVDYEKTTLEQSAVDAMAKVLEDALDALAYREADYSAVDKALASVPFDLSSYTEKSVQAVNDAVNAVVRGKNITEQNAVNAMAKAIENAVAALEEIPSAWDKNNLPDGVYSVYGEMIKLNRQDKSMSNDAINHTIKLTVEEGKYYLTMDFKGLSYLNRFGYLANLSYYDDGYTYGQYGRIEGPLIPAEVLSTQKNADGTDVIDEFNQPGGSSAGIRYPDQLKFPLVSDALADSDGYIPLHVFVPVMEDISEGTGDQDVLLKLDWTTLTKTIEDDPIFQPEEPTEQSPAVDVIDAATGVRVHADKGVFEEGVKLVVTEITEGADYDSACSALSDVGEKFKLYEVHFEDSDGNMVQPNGTVTVSYPIPEDYDADSLVLYRINGDGSKTLIKGGAADGYYTVITKSFSNYALVEKNSAAAGAQSTQSPQTGDTKSPQTGDNSNLALWFMLMLASAGMLAVLTLTRKSKTFKGE